MGNLNHECPQCGAHTAAFHIAHAWTLRGDEQLAAVCLRCQSCDYPAAAILERRKPSGAMPISSMTRDNENPTRSGWEIARFFPAPKMPNIPEHLPDQVVRPLVDAEKTLHMGLYDTAAAMYGKALDVALLTIAEADGRTLFARIEGMREKGKLPDPLCYYLHDLRVVRNWAAHDVDPFVQQEVEEFGEATKIVLTYLFTLPGRVAALRARRSGQQ